MRLWIWSILLRELQGQGIPLALLGTVSLWCFSGIQHPSHRRTPQDWWWQLDKGLWNARWPLGLLKAPKYHPLAKWRLQFLDSKLMKKIKKAGKTSSSKIRRKQSRLSNSFRYSCFSTKGKFLYYHLEQAQCINAFTPLTYSFETISYLLQALLKINMDKWVVTYFLAHYKEKVTAVC